MYTDRALRTVPKFYNERNRPTHTLQEAKEIAKQWMRDTFDYRSMLDEKIQNVEEQITLRNLQQYLYNAAFKGGKVKWMNGQR